MAKWMRLAKGPDEVRRLMAECKPIWDAGAEMDAAKEVNRAAEKRFSAAERELREASEAWRVARRIVSAKRQILSIRENERRIELNRLREEQLNAEG